MCVMIVLMMSGLILDRLAMLPVTPKIVNGALYQQVYIPESLKGDYSLHS